MAPEGQPLEYDEERILAGAKVGGLTIAILFGAWRLAVTIDNAANAFDWFWLPFEWALLQFTLFLLVLPLALVGEWLFDRAYTQLWQSVLCSVVLAFLYGWIMFVFDLLAMGEACAFGIPFVNFLALITAGAVGGAYAHRVWFKIADLPKEG